MVDKTSQMCWEKIQEIIYIELGIEKNILNKTQKELTIKYLTTLTFRTSHKSLTTLRISANI